jgi:hypothetical protein
VEKDDDDDNDNFKMINIPCTFEISADDKNVFFQKFRKILKHYIFILKEDD